MSTARRRALLADHFGHEKRPLQLVAALERLQDGAQTFDDLDLRGVGRQNQAGLQKLNHAIHIICNQRFLGLLRGLLDGDGGLGIRLCQLLRYVVHDPDQLEIAAFDGALQAYGLGDALVRRRGCELGVSRGRGEREGRHERGRRHPYPPGSVLCWLRLQLSALWALAPIPVYRPSGAAPHRSRASCLALCRST